MLVAHHAECFVIAGDVGAWFAGLVKVIIEGYVGIAKYPSQELQQPTLYLLHHFGDFFAFYSHLYLSAFTIDNLWLHQFHTLRQSSLLLWHRLNESRPLNKQALLL